MSPSKQLEVLKEDVDDVSDSSYPLLASCLARFDIHTKTMAVVILNIAQELSSQLEGWLVLQITYLLPLNWAVQVT